MHNSMKKNFIRVTAGLFGIMALQVVHAFGVFAILVFVASFITVLETFDFMNK